jgi:hypothetical protein
MTVGNTNAKGMIRDAARQTARRNLGFCSRQRSLRGGDIRVETLVQRDDLTEAEMIKSKLDEEVLESLGYTQ